MYQFKLSYNTIHEKSFSWKDENTGYIIAVVKGKNSLFSDEELKDLLLREVEKYESSKN